MSSHFITSINAWLEEGQYQQVKNVILDPASIQQVREFGMEIILGVCSHLNSEKTVWSLQMEECCEFSLLMVAQLSNPKEVLIALQEQVAQFGYSSKFKILLLPFQAVLLRIPDKRGKLLDMVLATIGEHVSSLPLPDTGSFCEGKDRLLLDADPKVQCISNIYEALAEFYAPLVKQVALNRPNQAKPGLVDRGNLRERRSVLRKNLLKTMEEPLVSMDLHVEEGCSASLLRKTAEKLVHHLSCVCGDLMSLSPELEDNRCLSTVFYLVYGEDLACSSLPLVYSPQFVFHTVVMHGHVLLRSNQPLAIHKGLLLVQGILRHMSDLALPVDCLDHPVHFKVFQSLIWLAVSGINVREFKVLTVRLFRLYLNKLHAEARYRLLQSLLPTLDHPGLRGVIINIIKDQIDLCLKMNWPYFLHDRMDAILPLIWSLPNGVETDLLEQMDAIMAALNLARYLLLRDANDASGLRHHLLGLEEDFLEPLGRALKISRAHYELQLHKIQQQQHDVAQDVAGIINGLSAMPAVSPEQQKSVIRLALNSFDLLGSVLARVSECLQSFKNPANQKSWSIHHHHRLYSVPPIIFINWNHILTHTHTHTND